MIHARGNDMINKILEDVKVHIEGSTIDDHFDDVLVDYINTTFAILYQLGVGPGDKPFRITKESSFVWEDFLNDNSLEIAKEYVYRRVQMMFDPPQNSNVMQASKDLLTEMEWRVNAFADYKDTF